MLDDFQNILMECVVAREEVVSINASSIVVSEWGVKISDMGFAWLNLSVKKFMEVFINTMAAQSDSTEEENDCQDSSFHDIVVYYFINYYYMYE